MSSSWIRALFFLLDNVYKMWSTGWYKIRNVVSTANFLISGEYDFFPNNYRMIISNLFELNAPIPIFGFTNKSFAVKHEAHQPILSHFNFLCPSPLLWGGYPWCVYQGAWIWTNLLECQPFSACFLFLFNGTWYHPERWTSNQQIEILSTPRGPICHYSITRNIEPDAFILPRWV